MIHPYWVTFKNAPSGCVEDETIEAAREQATKAFGTVTTIHVLPYPANPRLTPEEKRSKCPSFCYQPTKCAGHNSCRARYACSE